MESDSKQKNLSVVQGLINEGSFQKDDSKREMRSLMRIQLTSEQFRLEKTGKIFSVCDLSEKGMGLYLIENEDVLLFSLGSEIQGTLNCKHQKFFISGEVRNIHRNRIGIEFKNLSTEVIAILQATLSEISIAQSLRLFPSTDNKSLWYRGSSGVDLFLKMNSEGICKQMIFYLFEKLIQWDLEEGFKTGQIALFSDENFSTNTVRDQGIFRYEPRQVKMDLETDQKQLSIAKKIILSSNLPEDFKKIWLFS